MKKLSNSELENALKAQPESGPVYAKKDNSPAETVQVDQTDVKLGKGQFGEFLTLNVEGVGIRIVNIRKESPEMAVGTNFRLEIWKAIRPLPATPARRAIALGTEKVFAIPA